MVTLLGILAAAAVGLGLATALRLPVVPLLIVVGFALAYAEQGLTAIGIAPLTPLADPEIVQDTLVLGLTFLVFAAGLELNPARVAYQRRAMIVIGLAQFFTMLLIGMAVTMLMGLSAIAALHIGLAVSASSTIVVVRILQSRRQFFEPFGRLVVGVLLLQDLIIIVLIAALSGAGDGFAGIVLTTLATVGLVLLTWMFMKWIAPWLIISLELDQESLLLVALAILFGFTGLAFWMQVPLVIGSFFAGVALSSFPVNGLIRGQLSSLNTFFLAIFFVSLGALLTLPTLEQVVLIAALTVVILLVTPLLVVVVAERLGISTRAAVESGLLLAQSSEFSIIVALLGVGAGHLEGGMLSVVAFVTVVTMISTSFIATDNVTWQLVRWHPSRRIDFDSKDLGNHIVMLGCGTNSRVLLDLLLLHGNRVVVVDEDPNVVQSLRERGVDALRGDGADEQMLRSVNAHKAQVIISTIRRIADNERMISLVGDVTVLVRVFSEAEARRVQRIGGEPVCEAQAAAKDFMLWFQERFGGGDRTMPNSLSPSPVGE